MEVMAALTVEQEHDENLALQCAILHDVIEDTTVTFEQLKNQFGEAVANGVLALSKDKNLPKYLQMKDSLRRIKEQPQEIWMVKLADRISNLQPPPYYWSLHKVKCYRKEAVEIHLALQDASPFLASRLASKIENYKNYI